MDNKEYRCINSECQKIITEKNSYICKSKYNFNQRMPVCKTCVNNLYIEYWHKYGDVRKALWSTCRRLDIPFVEDKFNVAINAVSEQDYASEKLLSYYISKLYSLHYNGETCFEDGITLFEIGNISDDSNNALVWGNFSTEDCEFLDLELEDWKKTHKCETKAELTLLKEICIKELEIRKARVKGDSTKDLIKELQDLMKTAAVSGDKANIANSGKAAETFGNWIKNIEQYRPAEWLENEGKDLFHDVDNVEKYFKDFVVRPLKNFVTGSRDFNVDEELMVNFDDEGD